MKRIIYLFPVFLFILLNNGCDNETGACVTFPGGPAAGCRESTYGECDIINGTWYEGQTCAELGFGKTNEKLESFDSSGFKYEIVIVDSCDFDNYSSK